MRKLKLLLMAFALLGGASSIWAQKDVTSTYITNATLSSLTGWTATNTKNQNVSDPADAFTSTVRGDNTVGYATEAYAGYGQLIQTAYALKQTITLPAGNYRLVCYAFFRQGDANDNEHNSASKAYLVAGESKILLKTLRSINAAGYANSQAEGANCFDSKMYRNLVEFTIDADNTPIEIGVEGTFDEARSWCIVGQFELFDLDDLASATSPTDMTYAITNPGFEYRDLSGWTNNGFAYVDNNDNIGGKSGKAYIEYYRGGGLENNKSISQTLTNMDNGLYEVTVYGHQQQGTPNDGVKLYANDDFTYIGSTTQDYSVRTTVNDGELTIMIKTDGSTANWTAFDKFRLKFYGDPLAAYQDLLDAAVEGAQALIDGDAGSAISATAKAAWQAVVDDNDNSDNAFTEESQFNTAIANITAANTNYQAMAAPYAAYNAMKVKANGLKNQTTSYTDEEGTAVSTLNGVISDADAAVEAALTAAAISEQTENVRKAAFAFLGAVTLNENATIDISAFIVNAGFDEALTSGWTITDYAAYEGNNWHSYSTDYSCGEFYQAKFNISQTLTDLPAGKSFKLKVQAFQRPGDITAVYNAYENSEDKTKNVTSEIYVNEKAQKIKNIVSEYSATELFDGTGLDDWTRDSHPADGVYVPNSMKGASVYFDTDYTSGVKFYESEVAAAANEQGQLQFGFRDNTSGAGAWTIFDNFRLYYAGDDLSGFAADLTAVISSVKTAIDGMTLSDAVKTKLKAIADSYEDKGTYSTAEAYTAAITAVNSIETIGARYEAVASLTKIIENIGTGVFQYNSDTNDELWTAYSTAKTNVESYSGATIAGFEALVTLVETAASNYQNQALNAPEDGKRYYIKVATENHAKIDNAIIIVPGSTSVNNPSGYGLNANFAPNANLAQAVSFTKVSGNDYTINFVTAEGTAYLTYGVTNGSTADHKNNQIQATTDASKKGEFTIVATSTDNVFNIVNKITNSTIACQSGGNIYTEAGNADFTLAEASQATFPALKITSDVQWGTRIFPFAPGSLDGVTVYSCEGSTDNTLNLTEVTTPVADTPYILFAENGCDIAAKTEWGVGSGIEVTWGLLTGVYANTKATAGTYVLQKNNNKVAFYRVDSGENKQPTVGVYRCYLTDPDPNPDPNSAREAFFFDEGEATAIDAISALTSGDAQIFNAAGAQLPSLQKGMNILQLSNGKSIKVMVK